ncbi:acyltransferase family protein [Dyella japonica]|uniref:Peptidoglycan/LPS O-acetylase OafA/YrhL n=1 Tax=Dyella japonica TaxID=231455 RepID=A0ABV2JNZ7_9GAMM
MNKDRSADGLRGLAALNVLLCHLLISSYPRAFEGLYPGAAAADATPSKLDAIIGAPFLNVLWNGNFAVCVFFVLSGYVLTKSFVDTGSMASLQVRAARRYLRLSVPILGSTLLAYCFYAAGFNFADDMKLVTHSRWLDQFHDIPVSIATALREGLYGGIFLGKSTYAPVLWTMKIEFIGSMLVFGFRAINPKGWSGAVTAATTTLALVLWFPQDWPLYMGFLAGSYLGQVKLTSSRLLIGLLLIIAIYAGSFDFTGRYNYAAALPINDWGRKHLFNVLGAVALLYVVRCGIFDRVLQSRPAQFLGRVSYSLYLVHITVLFSIYSGTFSFLQRSSHLDYEATTAAAAGIAILASLVIADTFERIIDRTGIRLSRSVFPDTHLVDRGTARGDVSVMATPHDEGVGAGSNA